MAARYGGVSDGHGHSGGTPRPSEVLEDAATWMAKHPNGLSNWDEFEALARGKEIAVFSDYDGTLTPIVEQPDKAFMSQEMREVFCSVADRFPTAIISGRGRQKVADFVQIDNIHYAGSHGLDIAGPPTSGSADPLEHQPVPWALELMRRVHDELVESVVGIEDASVENNTYCCSVHYRMCVARMAEVEAAVERTVQPHDNLIVTRGKKVYEVRPKVDWDKGKALMFLLEKLLLSRARPADAAAGAAGATAGGEAAPAAEEAAADGAWPDVRSRVFAVYFGDDLSDEDAFRALEDSGLGVGVLVTTRPKPTAAKFTLQNPNEVGMFLKKIVERLAPAAGVAMAAGAGV